MLSRVPDASARVLWAADVTDAVAAVAQVEEAAGCTVVTSWCDATGKSTDLLDDVLAGLAVLLGRLWPRWFGAARDASTARASADELWGLATSTAGVSPAWLQTAWSLAGRGDIPLVPGMSRSLQATQLARALDARALCLVIAVDGAPSSARLLGLARAAEWLARETGARVVVVAPIELMGRTELDAIAYDALRWPAEDEGEDHEVHGGGAGRTDLWPFLGQPHPLSAGEQRLASAIRDDADLRELFEFNMPVDTRHGSSYIADLLWRDGRVVVEVDSYRYHSGRRAFRRDRRRDFEMMTSGYRVLRIDHDEVIRDVDEARQRVRDVVAFVRAERAR